MHELDVEKIRKDFPILSTLQNGHPLVYLDSASTSQKPNEVIESVVEYYKNYNANIHRGMYAISARSTEAYINSKEAVAKFIGADSYREIVYCKNTTEAINNLAYSWAEANIGKNDLILLTQMEHHANIVPWQLLAMRKGARIEYARLSPEYTLDMGDYKEKLEHNPKLVSFAHASNVLGTLNDAKSISELAHRAGATVLIDGAQVAPHLPLDVKGINADFYAFSSHKMLGPSGVGVLYGREELLEEMPPVQGGGDMIRTVSFEKSTWNDLPWKFEAGTPNIEGGIGLGAAVSYLNGVGMEKISAHERRLTKAALEMLAGIDGIKVYGIPREKSTGENRLGVVSFNVKGIHPHDLATIFDGEGIAIRAGHHCAMPLVRDVLAEPAVARMSFYLYNTEAELGIVADAIEKAKKLILHK